MPLRVAYYHLSCINCAQSAFDIVIVKMFKFINTTTVVVLISCNNKSAYKNLFLSLVNWCCLYNLEQNVSKTKELVVGFRTDGKAPPPLTISGLETERVDSLEILGATIPSSLKWGENSFCIIKKAHQRLFLLRQLKKFGASREGHAAVLQSCDRKSSHLSYICVVQKLLISAEEAAG